MKALLFKYKSVLRFVVIFLGTYLLLSAIYSIYLSLSKDGAYSPDYITHMVARQSSTLINDFGYDAEVIPHPEQPTMKLVVEQKYLARIIEGCNSISIIILFTAFILAFSKHWKKTALFLLVGAVLIYAVNLIRIAVLAISLYEYPQYRDLLHALVFPGLIYGMVFILWMIWVRTLRRVKTSTQ